MRRLALDVLPQEYTVARLNVTAPIPLEVLDAAEGAFVSVTRTSAQTSLVCPSELVPAEATTEPGWRVLTVRGPLEFTLTGIIAALASELAAAGVSVFTISTFDTDHVLVKGNDLPRAVTALHAAGHEVHPAD